MRLISGPIYTEVEADFIENNILEELLTAPTEGGDVKTLYEDNRFFSGLLARVQAELNAREVEYDIEYTYPSVKRDLRSIELPLDYLPGIEIRPHQVSASTKLLMHGRGGTSIATGGGKSEIAVVLSKYLDKKTLIVSPYINSTLQTAGRYQKYGLDCGRVGGGYGEYDKQFVVAVAASLYSGLKSRDADIINLLRSSEVLILDEVHHLSSDSWTAVGSNCPAAHRYGLSASFFNSLDERYYEDMLLVGQTGEIVSHVEPRWLIDRGYLAEPFIYWIPVNTIRPETYNWHEVYNEGVVCNEYRNHIAVAFTKLFTSLGMKTLVLVQRHEHGKILLNMLRDPSAIFSLGGGAVIRWTPDEGLVTTNENPEDLRIHFDKMESGVLIGTQVYDEAIDLPSMHALVMAGGGKKLRKIIQRIGRAMHAKAPHVHVVDFWDHQHNYLQKHSRERSAIYTHLKYQQYSGYSDLLTRLKINFDLESEIMSLSRSLRFQTSNPLNSSA